MVAFAKKTVNSTEWEVDVRSLARDERLLELVPFTLPLARPEFPESNMLKYMRRKQNGKNVSNTGDI